MTAPEHRPDLVAMVRELCDPTEHRERYSTMLGTTLVMKYHTTRHPSLIGQLRLAAEPKSQVDAGGLRPSGSRPCAAIEAIDALLRIDAEAAAWLRRLGHDDPGDTKQCVRTVGSLVPSQDSCGRAKPVREGRAVICCTAHRIEHDVWQWWTWARIVTRWDLPAWQPDNTCPLCGARGTLKVRAVEKIATCTGCHESWDEATIGLLADHIRAENNDELLGQQEAS